MRLSALAVFATVLLTCAACGNVRGSSVRHGATPAIPHVGGVRLVTLDVPPGAVETGLVEVHGAAQLPELALEFVGRVAELGGDIAKVDSVRSKFEFASHTEMYTYSCGSKTCTGSRVVTVEVRTTQMLGRAFRTEKK